jgi:hypothetical protein
LKGGSFYTVRKRERQLCCAVALNHARFWGGVMSSFYGWSFLNKNVLRFQIIGEAERSLHDALCVLTSTVKETKTVYGGGKQACKVARWYIFKLKIPISVNF